MHKEHGSSLLQLWSAFVMIPSQVFWWLSVYCGCKMNMVACFQVALALSNYPKCPPPPNPISLASLQLGNLSVVKTTKNLFLQCTAMKSSTYLAMQYSHMKWIVEKHLDTMLLFWVPKRVLSMVQSSYSGNLESSHHQWDMQVHLFTSVSCRSCWNFVYSR